MKDLVDAAVAAAGRTGVRMTMLLLGGDAPAPTGDASVEANRLKARIQELEGVLQARAAQGPPPVAGTVEAGAIKVLQDQLQVAQAEITKLQGVIAVAQTPAMAPQSGAVVGTHDGLPLDGLGLDEKIAGPIKKAGIATIGALRTAYLAEGGLYGAIKGLTKDHLHAVGTALLRGTPSGGTPPPAPSGNGHAPATVIPADPTLPTGHNDRSWKDRFNAAKSKEDRRNATDASLKVLYERVKTEHPALVKDGVVDFEGLRTAAKPLHDQIKKEEQDLAIVRAQMIAMLWGCGLPIDCPSIQAAVEKAGIKLPAAPAPAPIATG